MRWKTSIPFLITLFLVSCLKQPGNHPPVIETILLNPSENHTPGSDIGVSAMVTDRDGDPLEYFWDSQGGEVAEPNQASSIWELSTASEPLSYESITLTVSDGKETVSKTETIQVSEGLIMSGTTYFAGTTIPVPGVGVSIGKFSVVSDELGHYFIEHLKEGNTVVSATKAGFDFFESVVYVDHPKSIYHIPLNSPSHTLHVSGMIKTVDHISFEGLRVVLLNPDESESELHGFTEEDGSFTIANVPVGTRNLIIRNDSPDTHFLNDSIIYQIDLDDAGKSYDARIKIKRTLLSDSYMSAMEEWEFDGASEDGFYLLGQGEQMVLKDYISIPPDAEDALLYLNSFVVGGCDLVGTLPSHRVWVSNIDNEYLGGISWGGEGTNFPAEVSWYPSNSPTFMNISGKRIRLHLELFEKNSCVPNPLWRVYHIEFSYYY
ncbi:MAG: hypothetical protein ABFS38_04860 [Bacteroidota bacterium]